jgi:hypothetical protein
VLEQRLVSGQQGFRVRFSQSKKGASAIAAAFTTSARPARNSRAGRVASVSRSANTAEGWWKAPTRFLPCARSTAVLPPTEESTIASSVVGNCTKRTPRIQQAAAKPARSPTTPPPSASTVTSRLAPASASACIASPKRASDFSCSPAGMMKECSCLPASTRSSVGRYSGATLLSLSTKACAPGTSVAIRGEPSSPPPTCTS